MFLCVIGCICLCVCLCVFMYLFPSELVSLPGRRCGRFGREGGMRTAAGNTHQPAHNLVKSEEKNFRFHNFDVFFIGAKSDPCLVFLFLFCFSFKWGWGKRSSGQVGRDDRQNRSWRWKERDFFVYTRFCFRFFLGTVSISECIDISYSVEETAFGLYLCFFLNQLLMKTSWPN